ncbi:hypothetical protein [Eubacterium sp.]|uniref:hypothetical protein n=1 Tax=Eubacterium sp. TaxID=142586 RepID=UPI003AF11569
MYVVVFDNEKETCRSFNVDNVKKIEIKRRTNDCYEICMDGDVVISYSSFKIAKDILGNIFRQMRINTNYVLPTEEEYKNRKYH